MRTASVHPEQEHSMSERIHSNDRRASPRAAPAASRARGFTLTELMVTLVVMSILTSVALASYRSFSLESRRATALTALSEAASRQEQFFLNNKTYTATVGAGGINMSATVDGGYYALSVDAPTAGCPIARCYVLRATPQGSQTEDSCGTLTHDSDGDKAPDGCW
jgi:type IV pilus assembly protein PilE